MKVWILETAEPDEEIVGVYLTWDDLTTDNPGKSWTPYHEGWYHEGHPCLYASEHAVNNAASLAAHNTRVQATWRAFQTTPGRVSWTIRGQA